MNSRSSPCRVSDQHGKGQYEIADWQGKENADEEEDVNVWEDNWDDLSVENDFSKQLRYPASFNVSTRSPPISETS